MTITVTGANDAPTANAGADAKVAEGASVTLDGTGSTDPDTGHTLTYAWARKSGETDNAVTLTNANTASASFTAPNDIAADATLTFVLTVSDGTESDTDEVVITVTGANAAATIGGTLTGAVTEDDEDKDEASGTVTVTDSDGANTVQAQTDEAGTYGTFSIKTNGEWEYELDNTDDDTNALAAGATATDAFAIASADGTAGIVTITVTGANDAPTANAGPDKTAVEGASVTLNGTGSSDPDAGTTLTYSWARKSSETDNAVTLTNADTASASFTAPNDIAADATLTFVLTVSDGTASDTDEVIITVTGSNAAATIGGTLTGAVTEDDEDKDEASGTVTVSDSDGADTVQAQTDDTGTYGTFSIKTNGEWEYALDNSKTATNALAAGATASDAFSIASADGTEGTVTITVTGANDAPTANAGEDKTVAEGASVTLDGTGSSDPDASATLTYSWARKAGETDNAVTLTNANTASASFTAPDDIAADATLTFVLTVSDGTASATDEVVITVTGANAAATIGGDLTGAVTEDDEDKDEASGTVTVTDSDGADTVQAQTDEAGTYGTFSIKTNGEWEYELDNTDDDTNALAAGATATDAFEIAAADGTAGTVTITVTGANDAPMANAGADETVAEGASVTLDGTGSSDPDAGTTLTYSWARKSGETDNAVKLTNADKASASFTAPNDIAADATLTFVLTVSDGTASDTDEVIITVTGENAAATIGGTLTGAVTEDDDTKDEASGTVTVSDSDGADTVQAQTDDTGTYGTFSIKTNGEWTYTLDNTDDDTNALAAGATAEDDFAIASADGTAGTVTITVTGANDAPTANAGADATVIEGASVTLDGTGSTDPDTNDALTYAWARKSGETDNAVTLTDADKASASFTAPDDIAADATLTFVLTVSDGTESDTDEVVITVTGANAAATFGGTLTGAVTEDDDTRNEATGTVSVTDSDGADTVQAQTDEAGTYGTFSIKTNGEWEYELDNTDGDTNALAAGATEDDAFPIQSADGTAGTVTITVTGANDAPTANAGANKTVTEGASVTLDGTGSSDPDASTTLTYSWARKAGETDNEVTLTNANTASASFTAPSDIAADATLTFVLTVSDGTASATDEVVITVTGANAAATFGGTLTGAVTEDDEDKDEATGTVTVTDSDGANTVQAQTDKAGTYGTFGIKTNGEWEYELDNEDDDTNALAAGATAEDDFAIASADGTAGTVTITVTGANDAPTADAGEDKTVIEGATVTLDGTDSSDPDAGTTLTYSWARKSGETDNVVTLTNANTASASFTAPSDIAADATLTFVLTVSDGTASATDEVVITVTGANAVATFGGTLTGAVTEDDEDKDEATGTVTVTDSDGADTVQAQTDKAGTYGTFSIKTNGEWEYTLDNTDDDTNALAAGATEDDAFPIQSADGTAGTVTITVTGANDAPTADAGANKTVAEGASVTLDGTGSSDPDTGHTLTYAWARKAGETDNAVTLTNADKASASFTAPSDIAADATLTFVLTVSDGTASHTDEVVITVTGANAAATFGGDLTGAVTEDDEDKDEASGTVTVTDSDGADTVQAQTNKAGTYGTFSIKTNGEWTYTLDNTDGDTNALAAAATATDEFSIQSADGTAGTVTITVTGANDTPTADAGEDRTVAEGASVTLDGTDSSDPDASTTLTYSWARKSGETDNAVTLTNANTASASFTAPDDIAADATLTFVLTVSDGTASATDEVIITVTGANAAATIGGDLTGAVTEDDEDKDEASGTVTVSDSDGADTMQAQTDKAGTYGTFSIKTNGEWTYTLDNTDDDTNALAAGATATDAFEIAAADGTAGTVTITVTGANDAPTANAGANKTVAEGASVTLDGTDSSDAETAKGSLTYSWARKSGETDNAVTLTNADKASASFTAPNDIAADATLTFVLTVSDGTASATDEVVITVTGANAAATIGGDLTGAVTEDDEDKDEASGTVTVSDSDGADTVQAQTDKAGTYGTFSIKTNGEWTYTLDNTDGDTNALAAAATATDEFSIQSADGTAGTVTITVTGANDTPTADAGEDRTVAEGASVTLDGTGSSDAETAKGSLTYSWARKSGETDNAVTLTNANTASASFTAPNDIAADATLTFVLTVSDGTASATDEVVITVTGANAAATFGGDLTGAVTEDDDTKDEASGTVTVSDSDGANTVQAQTDKAGTYGTFSIKTNGEWEYALDNSKTATNALAAGATAEDEFAIAAADGTSGAVTITVTGANDAPTANAGADKTVIEGASVTLNGTDSSDLDTGHTLTYSWARKSGETDNAVTLTNADKASASFTAPNDIAADATLTFVLTVSDGTASHTDEVVITVTGANAAATFGGDLTGAVTEDDDTKNEAEGTVTVTDSDGADTVQAQTDKGGTYGTFSIKTNGEWEYELDNTDDDTNALAAGATATDAFEIAAADGTAGAVTITVTGANDAPTANAGADKTVIEGATVTLDGTDSSDPDASATLTYSWARKSGETDNAVTLTNADKASASFTAPNDIAADATLTFVLTVSDGTASATDEVVITVTGENAVATFGGTLTGAVTEDDDSKDEAEGTVTVTDSDGADTVQAQTDDTGTYGTFSIKTDGEWTYTLDNTDDDTNALAAGATATDAFEIAAADGTAGTVTITVTGANDAPTANAGANKTVAEGATVTLEGTGTDPDTGTTLTYSWARKAGETDNAVTLTNANTASASFTAPNDIAADATLTFVLTVSDGTASATDEVVITVTGENAVATFGGTLTGAVTEDDDSKDEAEGTVTVTDSDGADTVQAQTDDTGTYGTFSIKTDGEWTYTLDNTDDDTNALAAGATATDAFEIAAADGTAGTVTITVTGANDAPTANAGANKTVAEGATVTLEGTGTDPDTGTTLTYSWARKAGETDNAVTLTNANTASASFTAPDGIAEDATLTFVLTVSDGTASATDEVVITVTGENAAATFSVSGPSSVSEGAGTATYSVSLSAEPESDVTVKYATSDGTGDGAATAGSDYTAKSGTLTFTAEDWNTAQTVDVAITDDAVDEADETFTFTLSEPDGGASLSASPSVATIITDNDEPLPTKVANLQVSPGDGSLSVSWTAASVAPNGYSVRWRVRGPGTSLSAINTVAGTSFNIPNLISGTTYVVRVDTRNAADNGVQAGTNVNGVGTPLGLEFSTTSLTVAEGATATYTVKLATRPTGDVTVAIAGESGGVTVDDTDPNETGDQKTLAFTPSTWNTAQTVRVRAAEDDDTADESATLSHTASGGGYGTVTGKVSVKVDDGTNVPATFGGDLTGAVTEDDEDKDEATGTVTVDDEDSPETVQEQTDVAGTYGTFSIKTNGEWEYELDNADDDTNALAAGATAEDEFAIAAADGTTGTVTITVTGANDAPTADAGSDKTVAEGATVTLEGTGTDPDASITLTYSWARKSGETDNAVTLTNANTASASFTAPDGIAEDATLTFVLTVSDGTASATDEVVITVTGENAAATFSVSGPSSVSEGAGTATYSVSLSAEPESDVTVKYATSDGTGDGAATAGSDYTAKSGTLTFTAEDWNTAQTVDVAITDDAVDEADETFTFTLSEPDGGASLSASPSVATIITDNDEPLPTKVANLQVSPGDGSLSVSWTAASVAPNGYSVRWRVRGPGTSLSAINTVAGTSFNIPNLISGTTYVVRVDTRNAADNGVQAGTNVNGVGTPLGLEFSTTSLTVAEGATATYTVKLATRPTGDVTVAIAGESGGVTVDDTDPNETGDQKTLAFTPSTWNTAQTVRVRAAEDDDTADESATLSHTASGGGYGTVTGNVSVEVDDGTNVPATFGGDLVGAVTEDAVVNTVTGTVTVDDKDSPETVQAQTNKAGAYGTFSIKTNGEWEYELDNSKTATNALAAGVTAEDEFAIAAADGTAGTVTITVTGANDAPTANAGANKTVAEGASVTLDGTGSSDPDASTTLTYSWARKSGETDNAVTLTKANTASASFTAPDGIAEDATLTFVLRVTDEAGASATDEVVVTVLAPDEISRPGNLAVAGGDRQVTATWDAVAGVDGYELRHWRKGSDQAFGDYVSVEGTVLIIGGLEAGTTYIVRVRSVLGDRRSGESVAEGTTDAPTAITGDLAGSVVEAGTAPDGTTSRGVDMAAGTAVASGGMAAQTDVEGAYGRFAIGADGAWTYALDNADDDTDALADGVSGTDEFPIAAAADGAAGKVTITVAGANDAPVADAGADQTAAAGESVTLSGIGSDPDAGAVLAYSWARKAGESAPAVALANADQPTATFTAPDDLENDATLTFVLTVSDGMASATDEVAVRLAGAGRCSPTRARDLKLVAGEGSLDARWTAAACAPDGYLVRVREAGAGNAFLDAKTAVVDGAGHRLTGLVGGTEHLVVVDTAFTVTGSGDPEQLRGAGRRNVWATGTPLRERANSAPVIGHLAAQTMAVGETHSVPLSITDADGDEIRYRAVSSNPSMARVSPSHDALYRADGGAVEVTAVSAGETAVRVVASDGEMEASAQFQLTVVEPPVAELPPPRALLFDPRSVVVVEGGSAEYAVSLLSPPTGPVTVRLAVEGEGVSVVPRALTFDASDWDRAQTVVVVAAADGEVRVRHAATGGGYGGVGGEVPVRVRDDDQRGIRFDPPLPRSGLEEGATTSYGVYLSSRPSGPVTVSVASGHAKASASPSALAFGPNRWQQPQEVTVRLAHGAHAASPVVSVSHVASGADYGGVSAERTWAVLEPLPPLSVSLGAADPADEGSELLIPVVLSSALGPGETVRLRCAVGAAGDTASAADWHFVDREIVLGAGRDAGMIRIEILDDGLSEPEETLTVALPAVVSSDPRRDVLAPGGVRTYAIAASDVLNLSLATSADRILEGGESATFRVSLSGGELESALSVGVSVHPSSTADAGDVVGLPDSLTLSPGQREAEFSVAALREPGVQDEGEESLTLALTLPGSGLNASVSEGTATVLIDEIDGAARRLGMELSLASFARAVGSDLVDAVGGRARALELPGGERSWLRLGGASLTRTLGLGEPHGSASGQGTPDGWGLGDGGAAGTGWPGRRADAWNAGGLGAVGGASPWRADHPGAWPTAGRPSWTPPGSSVEPHGALGSPRPGPSPGFPSLHPLTPVPGLVGCSADPSADAPCFADRASEMELAQALHHLLAPLSGAGAGSRLGAGGLLFGSDFLVAPTRSAGAESDSAPGRWALWGRGSVSRHSLERGQGRVEGDLLSARVGFDLRLRKNLLAGVAVSRDGGSMDYRLPGGGSGSLDADTTGVHPYVHWRPAPGLGAWATLGYGGGDARLDDGVGDAVEADIEMGLVAAGIRREMFETGGANWALKSDAFLAGVRADEVEDGALLLSASARAWRLRAVLEANADLPAAGLSGTLELGLRLDGGDAARGGGAELGAGLAYASPAAGLEAQLRGRWMSSLRSSRAEEWGASLNLAYSAGVRGQGLSVTASPEWGRASANVGGLWEGSGSLGAVGFGGLWEDRVSLRIPVRVGYGLGLGGNRLLTPFAEWTSGGSMVRRRLGAELSLPSERGFDLRVGLYRDRASGDGLGGLTSSSSPVRGLGLADFGGGRFAQGSAIHRQPMSGYGIGGCGSGHGTGGYGSSCGMGSYGSGYGAGGYRSGYGMGGYGNGLGGIGYGGPEGAGMALEALLSRPLGDGRGQVSLGGKALSRESSLDVEALLQFDLLL